MPNFTFNSPDGKQYTVSGPDGATQEQAFSILRQQHPEIDNPPTKPAPAQSGMTDEQAAEQTRLMNMHGDVPEARAPNNAEALSRTGEAIMAVGGMAAGALPMGGGLSHVGESGPTPGMHTAPAELQEAHVAMAPPGGVEQPVPRAQTQPHKPDADMKLLGQEGYEGGPTEIQGTNPTQRVPGQTAEKLAGPDLELGRRQLNNQVQSTRLGGQVLGKTNAQSITPEDVTRANVAPGATYSDVGTKVGTFKASDAFINEAANIKDDPIAGQAGVSKMLKQVTSGEQLDGPTFVKVLNEVRQRGSYDLSNAMEDELEHQLTAKYGAEGSGAILDNLRDARQQFARNYLVRDSLKGGQVDASVVNSYDKANPGKLDGELATVAKAGDKLPESSKMPQTTAGAISAASPHQMHIPIVGPAYNAVQHAVGRGFMPSQERLMGSTPNPAAPTPPHGGPLQIAPLPPAAPPPLSLEHPPGAAYTPAQRPLSGPYEPNRNPMARAEWDRQVLARARAARAHGEGQ